MKPLASRDWLRAWRRCALVPPPRLCGELLAAYAEPHRAYHNRVHLAECLALLKRTQHLAERPHELALALWFHDAVYDPRRADNELRSARWARRALLAAGAPCALAQRIRDLVLATRHARPPATPDAALLLDLDLAILGAPRARFDQYERQIREEYAFVAEDTFRAARAAILRKFLTREHLYHTSWFQRRWEARARRNLERSVAWLAA